MAAINNTDYASIFEEVLRAKSLGAYPPVHPIYGETENAFSFGRVSVGQSLHCKFKLTNTSRVGCQVNINIKSKRAKNEQASGHAPAEMPFTLDHTSMHLEALKSQIVTCTFAPQNANTYNALFEAVLEGNHVDPKHKSLVFDLIGESSMVDQGRPGTSGAGRSHKQTTPTAQPRSPKKQSTAH